MKVTAIVVHVVDLVEALGSAARAAELLGQPVAELVRWAAVTPWLLAIVREEMQGTVVVDVALLECGTFAAPFASVADVVARAGQGGHALAAFGPSLAWCTVDELRLLGVERPADRR